MQNEDPIINIIFCVQINSTLGAKFYAMHNPKDILVTTTSTVQGLEVKQYLKPVSAQIVLGAGFFNDFSASFTDLFGGHSDSYQKRLAYMYNDAIAKIKNAAYEIGANCILGLSIDIDEISGKGKEMFMISAIGTAVIIDNQNKKFPVIDTAKVENVSLEKLNYLKRKKQMLAAANAGSLVLDDAAWGFIISGQVHELFDFILLQLRKTIDGLDQAIIDRLYKNTVNFLASLPGEMQLQLICDSIKKEKHELLAFKLCEMAANLQLLDFSYIDEMLQGNDFEKQKRALRLLLCNKPFYNKQDVEKFKSLIAFIRSNFPERGKRFMKKQLLSSKEKEMWTCECGNTGDVEFRCSSCGKDLFGFKENEITPAKIEERIELILEFIE